MQKEEKEKEKRDEERKKNILMESDDLIVKPSLIEGAGWGTFAKSTFKKGQHITNYTGTLLNREELEKTYAQEKAEYVLQCTRDLYIDGRDDKACFGRYINTARNKTARNKNASLKMQNNARFVIHPQTKSARIVALSTIHPGSEIFVAYGSGFNL